MVLFELVTVFQALVLVLADQLTSYARALAHGSVLPVADFNLRYLFLNPVYRSCFSNYVNKNIMMDSPGKECSIRVLEVIDWTVSIYQRGLPTFMEQI